MLVILDNKDSFTYNLYQLLCGHYNPIKVVRSDQISLQDLKEMNPAGIVISPGPGRPEDAGISLEAIHQFSPTIPILGVCLGHQAIAMAFGGEVINAGHILHGKTSPIYHLGNGLFESLPIPFQGGRYHSLIAKKETLPSVLQIEAVTGNGVIMALKHRSYPCYGVQFHPESVLTPCGSDILKAFIQEVIKHGANSC